MLKAFIKNPHHPRTFAGLFCGLFAVCLAGLGLAAETELQNGVRIPGKPIPIQGLNKAEIERTGGNLQRYYPILMLDDGMRRYFVPGRQVKNIDHAAAAKPDEEFLIKQKLGPRRRTVGTLGAIHVEKDFDEFGRRVVSIRTPQGPMNIVQGVTKVTPKYLTVSAMTQLNWEYAISTTSLPEETLARILQRAIDTSKPEDRLGIAVFYMQAGYYLRAAAELQRVATEFPELKDVVDRIMTELNTVQADQLLTELRMRRQAGQHKLAAEALTRFPSEELSAAVRKSIDEFAAELKADQEKLELAQDRLATLQQALPAGELKQRLEGMRVVLRDELDIVSLPRLEAFLNLESDLTLSPQEKLSLAYSGWLLGSASAVTDIDRTLRYWSARTLVMEILRTREVNTVRQLLGELTVLEGVDVKTVASMLPLLPPLIETPNLEPGIPQTVSMTDPADGQEYRYHALLPPEYSPHHRYPAIIALHPAGRPAEAELVWWGGTAENPGQAQRRGYIVIAPEYCDPNQPEHDYGSRSAETVKAVLHDASKRFRIDRDRVFLSGHGRGGDAACDIAMSHPDWFAGAIPIAGRCAHVCKWYSANARFLSWYFVSGELARNSLNDSEHASVLTRMMRRGHDYDLIVAEYMGRGYDNYYEEIHRLFDWMELRSRGNLPWMDAAEHSKFPQTIEATIMRPGDNEFFWIRADELPKSILAAAALAAGQKPKGRAVPIKLEAQVLDGSDDYTKINISSGARAFTLNLSPDLIKYNKRLQVTVRGTRKFNEFIEPQMDTLLADFRERADREKLIWTRLRIE